MRRALLAAAAAALLAPAVAWAHATLESTSPGFQQELRSGPAVVRLRFDQFTKFPSIEVLDSRGVNHAAPAVASGLEVTAKVGKLPAGVYTVRWHVMSADSHVVSGVWTFGVRVKAPPPTEAYGASGPTTTEHVVRWLYFVALALTIGPLGFRLLLLRGVEVPPALERSLLRLGGAGVVGVLEIGILAFLLRCEDVLQLPFLTFLYGDLSPIADGTRYGRAFVAMTLGFALVAAFVYLAWLLERAAFLWPALVLSLLFVAGNSVSGHDGVDPGSSWCSELADWVHLGAGSLWIGGLVALAVAWRVTPALRRLLFARFSALATVLVALVLAAGTYLAIVRLPAFHDLWRTGYGQVLLVKVVLVAAALSFGAVHHLVVRPRLAAAGEGFVARVGRSVAGESAVAVSILLLAAVLTDSKPPPQPVPAAATSSSSRSAYAGAVGASSWRK